MARILHPQCLFSAVSTDHVHAVTVTEQVKPRQFNPDAVPPRYRQRVEHKPLGSIGVSLLNNLKIRTKLNVFVGFISILLVGVGITGLYGIHVSKNALASVYNNHLIAINELNDIRNHQMQIRLELLSARQETDAFEIVDAMDRVRTQIFQTDNILKPYSEKHQVPEEKVLLDAFIEARLNFGRTGVLPMMDLLTKGANDKADTLRKQVMDPAYSNASAGIDALINYQVNAAKQEFDRITLITNRVQVFSLASIGVGLVLSVLIGFVITRSISRGVAKLESTALKLADGDLTARATLQSKDELGEVAGAFNRMAQDFSALISQVRNSADEVAGSAGTLSDTATQVQKISRGQTDQAASAAISIEELNQAVKDIAGRAENVVMAAGEASDLSDQGRIVVNDAVKGIEKVARTVNESAQLVASLGKRSNQIGQIIQVIKGIAEQTNLLALNAAIEAARAGEQGRGFAVVADEVRSLAERTANATSEISEMITTIQAETSGVVSTMERGSSQVTSGVQQASQAVDVLQKINNSVKHVVEMIQGIASATRAQSEATDEITVRVEDIARMARENSAFIEQTTDATRTLHKVSRQFQTVVSRFKL